MNMDAVIAEISKQTGRNPIEVFGLAEIRWQFNGVGLQNQDGYNLGEQLLYAMPNQPEFKRFGADAVLGFSFDVPGETEQVFIYPDVRFVDEFRETIRELYPLATIEG